MKTSAALVTGSSRGIGRAIALRLARAGYAVAVNYASRRDAALEVVQEIEQAGGRAAAFPADVGSLDEVRQMAVDIERELALPVDVLVNNAGILRRGDLGQFDPSAMAQMQRINVDGVIHATTVFAEAMRHRGYGRIVNITSIAAHGTCMPGNTFYGATKAAVTTLTRRFAMTLSPDGITVNAVAPGFIETDMVSQDRTPQEIIEILRTMAGKAMTGRTGTVEDIAHAVAFLAAPESGFITAQVLKVDGGRLDYIA